MKEESRAILEMIDDLQNRFEGLMIGYEYKENSITHFVKIKTESGGKLSKEISDYCFEFLMKFLEKYSESLCFLDDESPFYLDNPRIFFKPRMETDRNFVHSFDYKEDKEYYLNKLEIENYELKDVSNTYYTCAA